MNNLDDYISQTDIHVASINSISPNILLFQRHYNPLHMYCRLRDCGLNNDTAKVFTMLYEQRIYKDIIKYIKKQYTKNEDI